jgi:hypothetical protein
MIKGETMNILSWFHDVLFGNAQPVERKERTFDVGRLSVTVNMKDGVQHKFARDGYVRWINNIGYCGDYDIDPHMYFVTTAHDIKNTYLEKWGKEDCVCINNDGDNWTYVPMVSIDRIEFKIDRLIVTEDDKEHVRPTHV